MKILIQALVVAGVTSTSPAFAESPCAAQSNSQIAYVVPGSVKSIVNLAVDYMKPRKNGVAILIADGHQDEITGKEIAELFIKWFDEKYGIRVMCFVDAPENVPYSFASFIVGDIPYGPWNLMDAKNNMDTIAAAYDANIQMRVENE